jgi:hypothetical protein
MKMEFKVTLKKITSESLKQKHSEMLQTNKWIYMPFQQKQDKLFTYKMLLNSVIWFELTGDYLGEELISDDDIQGIIDLESEISQKVEQEFSVIMAKQAEKKIFNAKNNMSHLFNNRSSKCY